MSQNESFRVAGSPHVSQPSGFAALVSRWLTSMGSPAHARDARLFQNQNTTRRVGAALLVDAIAFLLAGPAATPLGFCSAKSPEFFSGGAHLALLLAGRDTSRFLFC